VDNVTKLLRKAVLDSIEAHAKEPKIVGLIRAHREKSNVSQRQFAADLGISPAYLNDIELGRRGLSAAILEKLEEVTR
jgi:transcriptional regulator with XRE-family HTH domain